MNTSRISPDQHRLRCRLPNQPLTRTRPAPVRLVQARGILAPDPGPTPTLVPHPAAAVADGPTHALCPDHPGEEATHTHLLAPAPLHPNLAPAAPSRTADPRADPCHEHLLDAAVLYRTTPVGITPARHLAQSHHHHEGNAGTGTGVTPARCLDPSHPLANNNGAQHRKDDVTRIVSRRLLVVVVVVGMILARLLRRVVVVAGGDTRTRCRGLLRRRRGGVVGRLRLDRGGLVRLIIFNGMCMGRMETGYYKQDRNARCTFIGTVCKIPTYINRSIYPGYQHRHLYTFSTQQTFFYIYAQ